MALKLPSAKISVGNTVRHFSLDVERFSGPVGSIVQVRRTTDGCIGLAKLDEEHVGNIDFRHVSVETSEPQKTTKPWRPVGLPLHWAKLSG